MKLKLNQITGELDLVHSVEQTIVDDSKNPISSKAVAQLTRALNDTMENKQDVLIFDRTPIIDSSNPVTSDGIAKSLAKKADLTNGKVPAEQLPSYVDDVIEGYFNGTDFFKDSNFVELVNGGRVSGKIYLDIPTKEAYRFGDSQYILISNTRYLTLENIENNESECKYALFDTRNNEQIGSVISIPAFDNENNIAGLMTRELLNSLTSKSLAFVDLEGNQNISLLDVYSGKFTSVGGYFVKTTYNGTDYNAIVWFNSIENYNANWLVFGQFELADSYSIKVSEGIHLIKGTQNSSNPTYEEIPFGSGSNDEHIEFLSHQEYLNRFTGNLDSIFFRSRLFLINDEKELMYDGSKIAKDIIQLKRVTTITEYYNPLQYYTANGTSVSLTETYLHRSNFKGIRINNSSIPVLGESFLLLRNNGLPTIYIWLEIETGDEYIGNVAHYVSYPSYVGIKLVEDKYWNVKFIDENNNIWENRNINSYGSGNIIETLPIAFDKLYYLDGEYQYWNGNAFCKIAESNGFAKTGDIVIAPSLSTIAWEDYLATPSIIGTSQVVGIVCDPIKKTFISYKWANEIYGNEIQQNNGRYYYGELAGHSARHNSVSSGKDNSIFNRLTDDQTESEGGKVFPIEYYFPIEKVLRDSIDNNHWFVPAYNEIVPFYGDIFYDKSNTLNGSNIFNRVREINNVVESWNIDDTQISTPSPRYFEYIKINGTPIQFPDNWWSAGRKFYVPLMGIYLKNGSI